MDALSETLRVVQLVSAIFTQARFTAPWAYQSPSGWLAGMGDRIVGNALNALHARPAHAWALEELAREAGTSRSVLAKRFQQLVGNSPMQYLTQWRMLLAANLLRRSSASLASIAEDVGYQTDTAFSRAFRREFGSPPARWRRDQLAREAVQ